MASRAWLGTNSSDGQTASNWSGGAVPIAGDTIVGDARAVRALTTGTDFGGILMVDIKFYSTYPFDLGSSSLPFSCRCSGEFLWQGAGSAWITAKGGNLPRVIIDTDSGNAITLDGVTGAMTKIEWRKGIGTINNSTNIDYLFLTYRDNIFQDSRVTVSCLNGIDEFHQSGGVATMMKFIATGSQKTFLSAGMMDFAIDDGSSGAMLDALYQTGGTLLFRSTSSSPGITTHYFDGGSLIVDGAQATAGSITTQFLNTGAYFPTQGQGLIAVSTTNRIGVP